MSANSKCRIVGCFVFLIVWLKYVCVFGPTLVLGVHINVT